MKRTFRTVRKTSTRYGTGSAVSQGERPTAVVSAAPQTTTTVSNGDTIELITFAEVTGLIRRTVAEIEKNNAASAENFSSHYHRALVECLDALDEISSNTTNGKGFRNAIVGQREGQRMQLRSGLEAFLSAALRRLHAAATNSGGHFHHTCQQLTLSLRVFMLPTVREFIENVPAADQLLLRLASTIIDEQQHQHNTSASPSLISSSSLFSSINDTFCNLRQLALFRVQTASDVNDRRDALEALDVMQVLEVSSLSEYILPDLVLHVEGFADRVRSITTESQRGAGTVASAVALIRRLFTFLGTASSAFLNRISGRSETQTSDLASAVQMILDAASQLEGTPLVAVASSMCALFGKCLSSSPGGGTAVSTNEVHRIVGEAWIASLQHQQQQIFIKLFKRIVVAERNPKVEMPVVSTPTLDAALFASSPAQALKAAAMVVVSSDNNKNVQEIERILKSTIKRELLYPPSITDRNNSAFTTKTTENNVVDDIYFFHHYGGVSVYGKDTMLSIHDAIVNDFYERPVDRFQPQDEGGVVVRALLDRIALMFMNITSVITDKHQIEKHIRSKMNQILDNRSNGGANITTLVARPQPANNHRDDDVVTDVTIALIDAFPTDMKTSLFPDVHQLRLLLRRHEGRSNAFLRDLLSGSVGKIVTKFTELASLEFQWRSEVSPDSKGFMQRQRHVHAPRTMSSATLLYDTNIDAGEGLPPALANSHSEYPLTVLQAQLSRLYNDLHARQNSAIALAVEFERVNVYTPLNFVLTQNAAASRANTADSTRGQALTSEELLHSVIAADAPTAVTMKSILVEGRSGIGKTSWAVHLAQLQNVSDKVVIYVNLADVSKHLRNRASCNSNSSLSLRELLFISFGSNAKFLDFVDQVFFSIRKSSNNNSNELLSSQFLWVLDGLHDLVSLRDTKEYPFVKFVCEGITKAVAHEVKNNNETPPPPPPAHYPPSSTYSSRQRPSALLFGRGDVVIVTSREERGGSLPNPQRVAAINPWTESEALWYVRNYFKQPSVCTILQNEFSRSGQTRSVIASMEKAVSLIRNKKFSAISTSPDVLEMLCWYAFSQSTSAASGAELVHFYDNIIRLRIRTSREAITASRGDVKWKDEDMIKLCIAKAASVESDGTFVVDRTVPAEEGLFLSGLVREKFGVVTASTRVSFAHHSFLDYFQALHFSQNLNLLGKATAQRGVLRLINTPAADAPAEHDSVIEHVVFTSYDEFTFVTGDAFHSTTINLELTCLKQDCQDIIDIVWLAGTDEKGAYERARARQLTKRYIPKNTVTCQWNMKGGGLVKPYSNVVLHPDTPYHLVLRPSSNNILPVRCKWWLSTGSRLSVTQQVPFCDIPNSSNQRMLFQFLCGLVKNDTQKSQLFEYLMNRLSYHHPRSALLFAHDEKAAVLIAANSADVPHSPPTTLSAARSRAALVGLDVVVESASTLLPPNEFGKKLNQCIPKSAICEWALLPCATFGTLSMWKGIEEQLPTDRRKLLAANNNGNITAESAALLQESLIAAVTGEHRGIEQELVNRGVILELPLACKLGAVDVVKREVDKAIAAVAPTDELAQESVWYKALIDSLKAEKVDIAKDIWQRTADKNTPSMWRLLFDVAVLNEETLTIMTTDGSESFTLTGNALSFLREQFESLATHCGEHNKAAVEQLALKSFSLRTMSSAVTASVVSLSALLNTLKPLLNVHETVTAVLALPPPSPNAPKGKIQRACINFLSFSVTQPRGTTLLETIVKGCDFSTAERLEFEDCNSVHVPQLLRILSQAEHLTELSLLRCDLSSNNSVLLPSTLRHLHIKCSELSTAASNSIRNAASLSQLTVEDVSHNAVLDLVNSIQSHTSLQTLEVINVPQMLPESIITADSKFLASLKSIAMTNNLNVTDESLRQLTSWAPGLTRLDLSACSRVTDDGLEIVSCQAQNLTSLVLCGCTKVTSHGIRLLSSHRSLTSLALSDCNTLTDNDLMTTATSRPLRLRSIDFSGITNITESGIAAILALQQAEEPPMNVVRVSVSGCSSIDGKLLERLSPYVASLKHVSVGGCKNIDNTALSFLAQLVELTSLDISGCDRVTDEGLQHLSSLHSLTHLNLEGLANITSDGISHLVPLKNLTTLNLVQCNEVCDTCLRHLANSSLTSLNVSSQNSSEKITDDGIRALANLDCLMTLDISGRDKISNALLEHIALHHTLTSLNVSWCYALTDEGFKHLSSPSMRCMTFLAMSGCRIGDECVRGICSSMTLLTHLDLSNCTDVSAACMNSIASLSQLRELHLCGCSAATDEGMSSLANSASMAKTLRHLDVSETAVTDVGVGHIGHLVNLRHLNLKYVDSSCDLTNLTQLEHLKLRNLKDVSYLTLRSTQLRHLELVECNVTDNAVGRIVSEASNSLEYVDLCGCPQITDVGLSVLLPKLKHVRHLNLYESNITDNGLRQVGEHLKHLQHLNLGQCSSVGDDGVEYLASSLDLLQDLDLSATQTSNAGLDHLREASPHRRKVAVWDCINISENLKVFSIKDGVMTPC